MSLKSFKKYILEATSEINIKNIDPELRDLLNINFTFQQNGKKIIAYSKNRSLQSDMFRKQLDFLINQKEQEDDESFDFWEDGDTVTRLGNSIGNVTKKSERIKRIYINLEPDSEKPSYDFYLVFKPEAGTEIKSEDYEYVICVVHNIVNEKMDIDKAISYTSELPKDAFLKKIGSKEGTKYYQLTIIMENFLRL